MRLFYYIMRLLFPPKCILCTKLLSAEETDLCRACRMDMPIYYDRKSSLHFLDSLVAVWYYDGNVRNSILRYKFHKARGYARVYGQMLAMSVSEKYPQGFDYLTWVPVSPLRKLSRGYDQVELLAKAVGRELGVTPVLLVKKIRNNRPQSRIMDPAARRANVLGAYRIVGKQNLAGKRILLLDDVLTTGATAGECARVLLTAGAKEVHCAVIAAARK